MSLSHMKETFEEYYTRFHSREICNFKYLTFYVIKRKYFYNTIYTHTNKDQKRIISYNYFLQFFYV